MFINPVFEQKQTENADWAVVLLPPFPFQAKIWRDVASRLTLPYFTVDTPGFVPEITPSKSVLAQETVKEAPIELDRAASVRSEQDTEIPVDAVSGHIKGGEQAAMKPSNPPETIKVIEDHPHIEAYADAVAEVARAHGIKHLVVCGNSLGGYVAISLAGRHPDLVAGLVLVGTNADADSEEKRANRLKMVREEQEGNSQASALAAGVVLLFGSETLQQYEKLALMATKWAWTESPSAGIIWAQQAMAARTNKISLLKALHGLPARVLRGVEDSSSTAKQAREMGDALGCKVIEIPQAGHLLPLEAPGYVSEVIQQVWDEAQACSKVDVG